MGNVFIYGWQDGLGTSCFLAVSWGLWAQIGWKWRTLLGDGKNPENYMLSQDKQQCEAIYKIHKRKNFSSPLGVDVVTYTCKRHNCFLACSFPGLKIQVHFIFYYVSSI